MTKLLRSPRPALTDEGRSVFSKVAPLALKMTAERKGYQLRFQFTPRYIRGLRMGPHMSALESLKTLAGLDIQDVSKLVTRPAK
jgi:hypothetical protein